MRIYTLQSEIVLKTTIEKAWDFFANPRNLNDITPDDMSFEILSELPDKIYSGLIIHYRIKPILNIPFGWTTEITHSNSPFYFVDEQRFGPYKFWHHQHHLKSIEDGVLMTDIVNYGMPFGIIGKVAHKLFVKQKLENIFSYRKLELEKKFNI